MSVLRKRLQQNFSRAAADYDARAEFQHVQTRRVLDAALMLLPQQATIADIGCGTGYFAHAAKTQRPDWQILGLDISQGMCEVANTRCHAIAGDALELPFASNSLDAVVSSLCYQWVEDQSQAFAELARVLKPGGRAIIATLGSATLQELRACAAQALLPLALLPMRSMEESRHALLASGLAITMADRALATEYYPNIQVLLDSMRRIGAGNNVGGARASITPKRWQAMVDHYEQRRAPQGIPATWEHHFFVVHKP